MHTRDTNGIFKKKTESGIAPAQQIVLFVLRPYNVRITSVGQTGIVRARADSRKNKPIGNHAGKLRGRTYNREMRSEFRQGRKNGIAQWRESRRYYYERTSLTTKNGRTR